MENERESARYELSELCHLASVTPRTVRYYIQQGLLPSPGQLGRGAKYQDSHLDRLRLIRRLQREHLPLAEIRARLSQLRNEEIPGLLQQPAAPPVGLAADYVRAVLASADARSAPASPGAGAGPVVAPRPPILASVQSGRAAAPSGKPGSVRSQWERILLAGDVELHLRRPLSRELNRRVERLLDQARQIFDEE